MIQRLVHGNITPHVEHVLSCIYFLCICHILKELYKKIKHIVRKFNNVSENEKKTGGLGKFKKTKKGSNFDVLKRGFLGGFSKKRGKNHDPE